MYMSCLRVVCICDLLGGLFLVCISFVSFLHSVGYQDFGLSLY